MDTSNAIGVINALMSRTAIYRKFGPEYQQAEELSRLCKILAYEWIAIYRPEPWCVEEFLNDSFEWKHCTDEGLVYDSKDMLLDFVETWGELNGHIPHALVSSPEKLEITE